MLLLVGLGNPGARYAGNRHNIGEMAVRAIAKRHGFTPWRLRSEDALSEGLIGGQRALLLLPQTFMNDSGRPVAQAVRSHNLQLNQTIVFHDEIELHPAYVKVKIGGGNAGHNGLRSITEHIGNDYRRVGIGVGRPPPGVPVDYYVLKNFDNAERDWVVALVTAIANNVDLLADDQNKLFGEKSRLEMELAGFGPMLQHRSSRPKRD